MSSSSLQSLFFSVVGFASPMPGPCRVKLHLQAYLPLQPLWQALQPHSLGWYTIHLQHLMTLSRGLSATAKTARKSPSPPLPHVLPPCSSLQPCPAPSPCQVSYPASVYVLPHLARAMQRDQPNCLAGGLAVKASKPKELTPSSAQTV